MRSDVYDRGIERAGEWEGGGGEEMLWAKVLILRSRRI